MLSSDRRALRSRSVFSVDAFRLVFAAAAVSTLGTQVSFVAIPLVAVLALRASPGEVGVLGMLSTVAFLFIGLPAGAWLDRTRRRRVMIAADLVRAALLGSVPVAWWLHALTIEQLYAVVLLTGVATVFFEIASQSYLPSILDRERLLDGNSRLASWAAGTSIAGPGVAGWLVALVSAPATIAVDAVSYLWSAACLAAIRRPEARPAADTHGRLLAEIREGAAFVLRHPLLRPIAIAGAGTNLCVQMALIVLPILFIRELGLPATAVGLFLAVGGVGVTLGALTARRAVAPLGEGPSLWIFGLLGMPCGLLVPMVGRGPWLPVAALCWLVVTYRIGMNNVILVSFRQRVTPDRLLGRMNATMRVLMTGSLAVGAALAGVIGQYASVRAALWVAGIGLALVWVPIFLSPLRAMRELPAQMECAS